MHGKKVLVTGAARGIGRCAAEEFARAGCVTILTDRDAGALETAERTLRELGAEVHARVVDVTDRAAVEALAAWIEAELGGLDVLVNNAGVGHHGELAATSLETWRMLLEVNLMGPLHHVYAFLPGMLRRGSGQIVNVSSGQAFFRLPTWGAYAAIKAALGVFSEILHHEVRRKGIHVTTVYPFMVNTGFYDKIEGQTAVSRLSMRLLPWYSNSPETVGKILFEAVRKCKRVEMVHPLNDVAFVGQVLPFFSSVISRASHFLLAP